jgi:acetate---CoA ligase (ADP-forming)
LTELVPVAGRSLIDLMMNPSSVVIVGASGDPQSPAGRPLRYLRHHGFRGRIIAINPRLESIDGVSCLPDVEALPTGAAEVAVVNLRAEKVAEAVQTLSKKDVRAAIVIGSGFEDSDSLPRRDLLRVLERTELRVIGPNCVGVMTPRTGAHLNFSSVLLRMSPRVGRVALVTQSGALGNSLLMSLLTRGAGIATWFSTGDELGVGALEVIAGLLTRDDVAGLGVFLEGFTDLEWLTQVGRAIATTKKPVFVLKAANSDLGRLAASGHTGRVVGNSDVASAILAEAGATEVSTVSALADVLVALDVIGGRLSRGRVAIVTVSGASGVLTADRVRASRSLELADIGGDSSVGPAAQIDSRIKLRNPLDVPFLDETRVFATAVAASSVSPSTDAVIAVESGLAHDRAQLTAALVGVRHGAPILLSQLCEDDRIAPDIVVQLAQAGICVMPTPERAVAALDSLTVGVRRSSPASPAVPVETLGLEEVAAIAPTLPIAVWRIVDSVEAAARVALEIGYPVVLKAAGRTIAHRSEAGAVITNVNEHALRESFLRVEAVCRMNGDAVVVQRHESPGFELLVAGVVDPESGPTVFVRPGGVLAELLQHQVVVWGGWDEATRLGRLQSSWLGKLLDGYRGGARFDLRVLARFIDDTLILLNEGRLTFIEFNPLILRPDKAIAVDVLAARRPA